jgi:hypothetical protein
MPSRVRIRSRSTSELRERGQDVEEHLAQRVGRVVDRAAEGQPDSAGGQGVADLDLPGIGDRPGQAVQLGDDQGVAGADGGQGTERTDRPRQVRRSPDGSTATASALVVRARGSGRRECGGGPSANVLRRLPLGRTMAAGRRCGGRSRGCLVLHPRAARPRRRSKVETRRSPLSYSSAGSSAWTGVGGACFVRLCSVGS